MSHDPKVRGRRPRARLAPTAPKSPSARPTEQIGTNIAGESRAKLQSSVKQLSDEKALGLTPLPGSEVESELPQGKDGEKEAPKAIGPSPERKRALEAQIRSKDAPVDQRAKEEMVDHAVASGSPELKRAMLDKLPGSPDHTKELTKIGETYQKEVFDRALKAYRDGKKDSPLFELGELFHVQTLGSEGGEFQGEIDQKKLGARIKSLMETDKNLQGEIGKISREVMTEWRGSSEGKAAIKKQTEYLKSDDFQQRLRLMSPEDRDKAMEKELTKLALLDPAQVSKVGEEVASNRLEKAQEYPLEGFTNMDAKAKEEMLSEVLKGAVGDSKTGAKAFKDIVKELSSLPATASRSQIMARLKAHGLSTNQGLTKVLGALSILGLGADVAQGKGPTDIATALSQAAALNSTGAAFAHPTAQGVARLAGAKNALALRSMPKTLKLLRASQAFTRRAPVIGDALGSLIAGHAAYEAFSKGDMAKGSTYTASAGLGVVAMGLGMKAATIGAVNGWNPFGWAALGVGLTATGVGFAASQMDGANEKLVKRLGLFDGAATLYHAMDGAGTHDGQLQKALAGKSRDEMNEIRRVYKQRYKESLDDAIKGDTSGHYEGALLKASRGHVKRRNYNPASDAKALEKAMRGLGTDESALKRIIMGRSPSELKKLAVAFKARTGGSLIDWVEGDTSGSFESTLVNQLRNAGVR